MTKNVENRTILTPGLRTLRAEYPHGYEIHDHDHDWGQLIYAAAGAIRVSAPARTWLIPPTRAVWLPPGATHKLKMRGLTKLQTIYVPPHRCSDLSRSASGLSVSPLFRELILTLVGHAYVDIGIPLQAALSEALIMTMVDAKPLRLSLTRPVERRALAVALAIEADPARDVTLAALAHENGTTLRTLQRRFALETDLPLSEWRQVARMMEAAARLLEGESVTSAALYAGYSGTSAFINAFKARCGETPGAFRSGGDLGSKRI